ncbi:hypothetical protein EFV80_21975, partial [Yersinia enterocolitica]|nr:hypothetical protein [Yersinia enterocolitica]
SITRITYDSKLIGIISLAGFLQLELSRVDNLVTYLTTQEKSVLRQLFFSVYDWPLLISYYRWL